MSPKQEPQYLHTNQTQTEMSKDKGSKNQKKKPADKSASKTKAGSDYKSEGTKEKDPKLDVFVPKPNPKTGGSHKS